MKPYTKPLLSNLIGSPFARTMGALICAGILGSSAQPLHAAESTWTGETNGTWDTTTSNWAGSTAFISGNDALFTGTPTSNVTAGSGLTIGAITLDNTFTGSVTLTGNNTVNGATTISSGTLTLKSVNTSVNTVNALDLGSSAVTLNSGGLLFVDDSGQGAAGTARTLFLANAISGAGTIQARPSELHTNGWSAVQFGNLSGFTGTLNVMAGVNNKGKVQLSGTQANLPSSSATVNVQNGGSIYLNQPFTYGFGLNLSGTGNTEALGALRLEAGANLTGPVTLNSDASIGSNAGTGTISGNIGGNFALIKVGAQTIALTGSNAFSSLTIKAGTLSVGNSNSLGSGTVTMSGGSMSFAGATTLSNPIVVTSGAPTFTAANGALAFNGSITGTSSGALSFAANTGKITLAGAASNVLLNANYAGLSITGTGGVDVNGALTISGNTTQASGYFNFNGQAAAPTVLTINAGGSLSFADSLNSADAGIGNNTSGTGQVVVNGGLFKTNIYHGLMIGNNKTDAVGILTVNSGTATIGAGSAVLQNSRNYIALGRDNATGIINLNGGVFETGRQFVRDGGTAGTVGSGTATFNFNGGTLRALASQTGGNGWFETATTGNFQVVTTNVKAGGAKIDTNSFNTNINTVLAHDSALGATADGGLAKSGAGTLSLGAVNTYTGATTVNGGTLALGAAGSIDNSSSITVGSGASFDVSAKTGFTVGASQTLNGLGSVAGAVGLNGSLTGGLSINGAVTAAAGSTISPSANNTAAVGSLTMNSLSQSLGAHISLQINSAIVGDKIITTADSGLTLAGDATFSFASSYVPTSGDTLFLILNHGAGAVQGSGFSAITIVDNSGTQNYSGAEGTQVTINGQVFNVTYTANADAGITGNDIALQAVPEPSTWAMIVGGIGMLVSFQRSRRRN